MDRYTMGFINHNDVVRDRFLGPSLQNLKGEFDLVCTDSVKCPAENYNSMMDMCCTDLLILTHEDVTFSPDLLFCIDETIKALPDFGVLGMVGVDSMGVYRWSEKSRIHDLSTLDCSFVVIRKSLGVRFDSKTFDDFHMYVEDYCAQVRRVLEKRISTILTSSRELNPSCVYGDIPPLFSLNHHSFTCNQRGFAWGRWKEYRRKLEAKWPGIKTT